MRRIGSMHPRPSEGFPAPLRRVPSLERSPLDWSPVDRCLLVTLIVIPFTAWFTAWEIRWLLAPDARPYVEPAALLAVVLLTGALLVGELATIAACLLLRGRSPGNEAVGLLFCLLYFVTSALISYLLGHYTTPQGGISALAGAVFFALLIGRRAALLGVGSFFVISLGTTVAEQTGWLPYGPLFQGSPFASGHLSGEFVAFLGAPLFAAVFVCALLADYLFVRWHEREAKLATVAGDLAEANGRLEESHRELSSAYERLKDAQVRLLRTEKMASVGRLAAGVAHEINNPLSTIASNLQPLGECLNRLVRSPSADDAEALTDAQQYLRLMARGSERTMRIVDDLRKFSRLNEATRKEVDLLDGIEASLRLLEPYWRDRVEIHRHYERLPAVECDAGQMNQVFATLLSNACDAIGDRGNLWIDARAREQAVSVAIRDDGRGIPPEDLSRVFDPFFTTKGVGRGTGLGLASAYGIVVDHGGRVEVESEVGRGTTFRVVLPVAGRQGRAPGEPMTVG